MKFYRAVIKANGEWPPDESTTCLLEMTQTFSIPDRYPRDAMTVMSDVLKDMGVARYMIITELQEVHDPDLAPEGYCHVCHNEHRKSEIVMIGQTRLIPGHEYQIVTNTPSTRYARSWRMGFLGTSRVSDRDLQFSARGPDGSTGEQYAGTQTLDKRYIVRAREVEHDDVKRYVAKKITDSGTSY